MLVLVAEKECVVDVTKTCQTMEEEWNKLLGIFYDKKAKTNFTLKAQMVCLKIYVFFFICLLNLLLVFKCNALCFLEFQSSSLINLFNYIKYLQ